MEGQLVLTHLPAGLTGFLVDDVVDVLPDTNLPRRRLSANSAMDIFDAFILRDEQVLFHTTFNTIDQAREIDYPNPDLQSMERMAAEARLQTTANESTAANEGDMQGNAAPVQKTGRDAPPQEKTASRDRITVPDTASPGTIAKRVTTPVSHNKPPLAPPDPARQAPAQQRRRRSSDSPARTRRYALALTGVLLLLLIVTLSSGVFLRQRMLVSQPQPTGTPDTPQPDITMSTESPDPKREISRSQPSDQNASEKPPPLGASLPLQEETADTVVPVEESPYPPPASTSKETPVPPEKTSESPREILRMETEAFTLTVERPSTTPQPPSALPSDPVPPISTIIVHRVIPGDTLWDIAAHYLGDPFQYPELARLSQIHDPDLIYPGDVIRIIKKGG